jgi:Divergent InlB B-repeat domain
VRRQVRASSTRSTARKAFGRESNSRLSRTQFAILAATIAAFLLVPVAQASANQKLKVNIEGDGAGEVITTENPTYAGTPPLECSYSPPGPKTGVCENEMSDEGEGYEAVLAHAVAAPGSHFVKWTIQKGEFEGCGTFPGCLPYVEPSGSGSGQSEITAIFACDTPGACEGPTNLVDLTVTKSANGPGGTGSVSSKPKGIKCGTTCSKAVAAMYKSTPVVLTEKPGSESTFVEWTGACSGSSPTCTVPMSSNESVGAVFTGSSKTITPTAALTLEKSGTGKGTVKAAGLGCEAECTSTTVLYQGPTTKPGKTVILKQAPAFGSAFSGWEGCDSETEAGECVVEMDEAHTVEAEYTALPNKVLTVNKAYSSGNGSVSSKPKGIKCGTACTQAVASMPEGASVELTAKPSSEVTFVKWEGGDCNGKTELVCVVTMNTNETTKAVFNKPSKALPAEATLTLNKAGKGGFGTVKAAGLGCEVLCTSTSVVYQGPTTKPGKTVVLKAASAPGSKAVSWSGCDSIDGEGNCVVEMDENHTITATFDELE